MRHTLETQANQIESVLANHQVSGRVLGGVVFPCFVQFQLSIAVGTQITQVAALAEEIAHSVGAEEAHVYQAKGTIQIEILPHTSPQVDLTTLCRRLRPGQMPPLTAVLGVSKSGAPVLLRLSSADVQHTLITGGPGSGKTALIRTLLLSLALYNRQNAVQFILIDPSERGLMLLNVLPHLMCPVISDPTVAGSVLTKLVPEMKRRSLHRVTTPHIVVAIDELSALLYTGGKAVESPLTELAQDGPAAGIHLVVCTRKPSSAAMGTLRRIHFPVRLVGAVDNAEEARIATGLVGSDAESLTAPGEFILVNRKRVLYMQAAYLNPEQIVTAMLDLKAHHAVWHRGPAPSAKILDFTSYQGQRQREGQRK